MSTNVIKYGAKTHAMKLVMPDSWTVTASVKLTLTDSDSGTALVSAATVTRLTANTTSAAAVAGAYSVVATNALGVGESLIEGATVAIGSTAAGFNRYTVDGYDASTKTLTLTTGLVEAVASGANVYYLDCTYTLDTTGGGTEGTPSTTWASVERVHAKWYTTASDVPVTETYTILKSRSELAGLELEFAAAYPSLYANIQDNFGRFSTRARERLRQLFESKGRDIEKIVDTESYKELMLLEIALLAARAGELDDVTYNRLLADRQEMMDVIGALRIWIDEDEDAAEDDEETQPDLSFGYSRGLR
jgi:hypothetical protein